VVSHNPISKPSHILGVRVGLGLEFFHWIIGLFSIIFSMFSDDDDDDDDEHSNCYLNGFDTNCFTAMFVELLVLVLVLTVSYILCFVTDIIIGILS